MNLRTVGVLGGMGPEATVLLQQRVINAVAAHDDADHVPLIIAMNPQVPSRLDWLLQGKGEDPATTLTVMAQTLHAAGAEALAMPCNTAHHFADPIEKATPLSLLNMPQLAVAQALKLPGAAARAGILASPAARHIQLFDKALSQYGCTAVYPSDQDAMLNAIKSIKARGPEPASIRMLQRAADELAGLDCSVILVGCSEFSLIARSIQVTVPVVDTLDVLVEKIVAFSGACPSPGH